MSDIAAVVVNSSKIDLKLKAMPQAAHDALVVTVTLDAGEVQGAAQSNASGGLLQSRSGKFVKSIKASVRQSKKRVFARVYSRDPRAALFEWGGTTGPHDILPKDAHALLLRTQSGNVFAAAVRHPGGHYGPRHIIHSAFDELKSAIEANLEAAVGGAIESVASQ
jgi:hypothetical protein